MASEKSSILLKTFEKLCKKNNISKLNSFIDENHNKFKYYDIFGEIIHTCLTLDKFDTIAYIRNKFKDEKELRVTDIYKSFYNIVTDNISLDKLFPLLKSLNIKRAEILFVYIVPEKGSTSIYETYENYIISIFHLIILKKRYDILFILKEHLYYFLDNNSLSYLLAYLIKENNVKDIIFLKELLNLNKYTNNQFLFNEVNQFFYLKDPFFGYSNSNPYYYRLGNGIEYCYKKIISHALICATRSTFINIKNLFDITENEIMTYSSIFEYDLSQLRQNGIDRIIEDINFIKKTFGINDTTKLIEPMTIINLFDQKLCDRKYVDDDELYLNLLKIVGFNSLDDIMRYYEYECSSIFEQLCNYKCKKTILYVKERYNMTKEQLLNLHDNYLFYSMIQPHNIRKSYNPMDMIDFLIKHFDLIRDNIYNIRGYPGEDILIIKYYENMPLRRIIHSKIKEKDLSYQSDNDGNTPLHHICHKFYIYMNYNKVLNKEMRILTNKLLKFRDKYPKLFLVRNYKMETPLHYLESLYRFDEFKSIFKISS